jgi:hypothetical protein
MKKFVGHEIVLYCSNDRRFVGLSGELLWLTCGKELSNIAELVRDWRVV